MKEKFIRYCEFIIEICLYLLIFCLPFAKAGVETFAWMVIAFWIIKRLLTNRDGFFPQALRRKIKELEKIANIMDGPVTAKKSHEIISL